ncbi:MAG TPA: hypothetical protein VFU23_04610 [Gemmatimonadales bacterium]|nr:hypothetical protein [Gemmatimonadales bacterium]
MRRPMALGLLALLAACGGKEGPSPPQAGDLVVSYFQGGSAAGAILFTISGGVVENVTVRSGQQLQVSFSSPSAGTTKVIVTGALATGDIITLRVPDVTLFNDYVIHTDQVADNLTFSLVDPSGHTFTVHR